MRALRPDYGARADDKVQGRAAACRPGAPGAGRARAPSRNRAMNRRGGTRRWAGAAGLAGALAVLAGCSSGPGRGFSLFPEGHKMIDQAKALRAAYPDPLPLPRELDKRVALPFTVEPGDTL